MEWECPYNRSESDEWRASTLNSSNLPGQGTFAGRPPSLPRSDFNVDEEPWWRDAQFVIGHLSRRSQFVRIKDIFTNHVCILEVPFPPTSSVRPSVLTSFKSPRR